MNRTSAKIAARIIDTAAKATTEMDLSMVHWTYTATKNVMTASDAMQAISAIEAAGRRVRRANRA